ncbi:cytochrome oxidase putative small subunit CydP [Rugamonas rubra]|uniref:Uncharacterized protein n=1 Tax=Rugamonas rubra TaxID=758825 RepID=A0A1I4NI18_9BURK|nr:cytochrome oxidase putative small subunit CydP [Rugamonas rubra]SFM14967.1 hypothetical protein SAMN02982985_02977 [Rugamonas rubra]
MPRRLHGSSLALAITLALLLKALILFGLWKAFFSTPQAKHMRVPAAQVQQHFFAAQQQQQQQQQQQPAAPAATTNTHHPLSRKGL